jgi:hypothetical protein
LNIFETIGIGYVILSAVVFTLELVYCAIKGISALRHLLSRGQGAPERRGSGVGDSSSKRHVLKLQ